MSLLDSNAEIDSRHIWDEVGEALICYAAQSNDGMVADYCIEEGITSKYFYSTTLQVIWEAILKLRRMDMEVDEMQIFMQLTEGDQLKVDRAKFHGIMYKYDGIGQYKECVKRIKESYRVDQLRRLSKIIKEECNDNGTPSDAIMAMVTSHLEQIDESEKGLTPAAEFIQEAYDDLTAEKQVSKGLETHLYGLNRILRLAPETVNIVAARPGLGKSSIATNIADYVATDYRGANATAIFSMEMSQKEVGVRLISSRARTNPDRIREWRNRPNEKVTSARDKLKEAPIFIDDSSTQTVQRMEARCRRLKNTHGLGLVIIDYFQLIMPDNPNSRETRQQKLGDISRALKRMAKNLKVPILVLAQLSRDFEKAGRKPRKSDLRECGDMEQDADIVVLLHQDEDMKDQEKVLAIVDASSTLRLQSNSPAPRPYRTTDWDVQ